MNDEYRKIPRIDNTLTPEERRLLVLYRQASEEEKKAVLDNLRGGDRCSGAVCKANK